MDWEYIGAAAGRFFLAIIEYCFKGLALLSAGVALSTPGVFMEKFSAGFASLTSVIRNVFELPVELSRQAFLISEYNSMPASAFVDTYGAQNIDAVFAYFSNAVNFFVRVEENLTGNFFTTISAAALLFAIFYLLAWVLRFARQQGQGSWRVQLERRFAEKVFKIPVQPAPMPYAVSGTDSGPSKKDQEMKQPEEKSSKILETKIKEKPKSLSNVSSPNKKKENLDKKKSKPKKKSPSPPPDRNEPDWLTNARKSTKEYRQAQASESH
ncbi:MAG: hypothetical protein U5J95_12120 [Balneolaceae bacterium]|nr:hypothetical protein [Balneolaceae bacterium]